MNQHTTGWEPRLTAHIADQIRHWRTRRGWSAQDVANRCRDAGHLVSRATLTNLENGRRTSITVSELLAVANALGVPPVLLVCPFGQDDDVELLPGQAAPVDLAALWLCGTPAPATSDEEVTAEQQYRGTGSEVTPRALAGWLHQHGVAVVALGDQARWSAMYADDPEGARWLLERTVSTVRNVRDALTSHGLTPPRLPDDVAAMVRETPRGHDAP